MTMRAISIGIFLLAQPLLACGDGEEDGEGDDGGAVIEPDQLTADLAALLCEAAGACDCEAGPETSDCVGALSPAVAGRVATGESLGLRYHAECLEPTRAYVDALACRIAEDVEGDVALAQLRWDTLRCKLFAGGDQLGDPCDGAGNVDFMSLGDSCAQGLFCAEQCYELVEAAGESCAFGACPPGKDCSDPDADGVLTCETPPAAGERCNPHGSDCEGTLVCDPMRLMCTEPPGPGEQCPQGQCTSGSLCVNGACELLPGDGDPCGSFGCAAGLRCDFNTNTCAPPVGAGEPCFYLEDCAEGLLCNTSVCAPLPGEGDDCPIGLCAADLECGFDGTCAATPPVTCELPFCIYRFDGLCDEPGGTGLCHEGTDPEDCEAEARTRRRRQTSAAST